MAITFGTAKATGFPMSNRIPAQWTGSATANSTVLARGARATRRQTKTKRYFATGGVNIVDFLKDKFQINVRVVVTNAAAI